MTETAPKRRHWRWVILACVLLLVGGPIAWQFRPLNATERRLVGSWSIDDSVDPARTNLCTFRPDRTVVLSNCQGARPLIGRWRATSTHLDMSGICAPDAPMLIRLSMVYHELANRIPRRIRFADDATLSVNHASWSRVPTPSPLSTP